MPADAITEVNIEALFSLDATERWRAARPFAPTSARRIIRAIQNGNLTGLRRDDLDSLAALPEPLRGRVKNWGKYFSLFGAVNAWLVFVGPSPGGSPTNNRALNNLLGSSPQRRNPTLGWPHPSYWYPDTRGFLAKIRQWSFETMQGVGSFKSLEAAVSNTLMLNLAKPLSGAASRLPADLVAVGARRLWRMIVPVVQPRLIIALTRGENRTSPGVYHHLLSGLPSGTEVCNLAPAMFADPSNSYTLPRATVSHPAWGYHLLIATVPNHPSRYEPRGRNYSALWAYLRKTARFANRIGKSTVYLGH